MARIRTIKPSFWEDEDIAALSLRARLLFIASWNYADDEGLLRWTPDYIKASVFMYETLSLKQVEAVMSELEDAGHVFAYLGGRTNQRLAYIPKFLVHQRINRPQPSKLPAPSLQSPAVKGMYGDRDGWRCHICSLDIPKPETPEYVDSDENDRLSLDHVHPKAAGGADHPSNIRASHQRCNKGKGARLVSGSVTDSVNGSVSNSPPERKGNEEEEGEGEPSTRALQCHDLMPPGCAPHLLDEIEQVVAELRDVHGDAVDLAVQSLVDDRRRFTFPSKARTALTNLLGPAPAAPTSTVMDEAQRAQQLIAAEGLAKVREATSYTPSDEEKARVLEQLRARKPA